MSLSPPLFNTVIYIALVLATNTFPSNAAAQSFENWVFVLDDETSCQVMRSIDAQNGESFLELDSTGLSFQIEHLQKQQYAFVRFKPSAYVVQATSVASYVAKYLHISGFARDVKPNFIKLEKGFSDYYRGAQKAQLNKLLESVSDKNQDDLTQWFIEGDSVNNRAPRFYQDAQSLLESVMRSRDLARNFSNLRFE